MTWIKICGTTNLEDAQLAVDAGADALGFIFAPSPRQITPKAAAEIINELPSKIVKVGVFVNGMAEEMAGVATAVGLNSIQLHGFEGTDTLKAIEDAIGPELGIIRALPGDLLAGEFLLSESHTRPNRAVLLDNSRLDSSGGTGEPFEWETAARNVRVMSERFNFKFIIAGGLTSENVGEAIRIFRPWGVDVVSGVESKPGKKDPQKLRDFIRAVREADKSYHV